MNIDSEKAPHSNYSLSWQWRSSDRLSELEFIDRFDTSFQSLPNWHIEKMEYLKDRVRYPSEDGDHFYIQSALQQYFDHYYSNLGLPSKPYCKAGRLHFSAIRLLSNRPSYDSSDFRPKRTVKWINDARSLFLESFRECRRSDLPKEHFLHFDNLRSLLETFSMAHDDGLIGDFECEETIIPYAKRYMNLCFEHFGYDCNPVTCQSISFYAEALYFRNFYDHIDILKDVEEVLLFLLGWQLKEMGLVDHDTADLHNLVCQEMNGKEQEISKSLIEHLKAGDSDS